MGDANDAFMRSQNAAVQARTKAQNRATVLQLKLIGQSHPTGLTPNLLKLFEPRPPLEFKPPIEKRKCPPLTGIAQYVSGFVGPDHPDYAPPVPECETPAQKKARIHKARLEKGAIKAAEELEKYDPSKDPNLTGDPYKTLFVARLNYETSEHRLKREFEAYGPIKRINLVYDKETRKPRGYAFIEYVHTRDMKTAYKQADGRKIDNRRVLVDVERGRTVANWRPRRLGGGLGSTRIGGEDANQKHSGRESQQPSAVTRRSEEPRTRRSEEPRERHVDREGEKSRDRGRDREREKSRERSHDRGRDRDAREERHHRDRDRNRDRERGKDRGHERERDRGRGRDRERDRVRDPREYDNERDRDRGREHDYEQGRERDRRRERDRDQERDYGRNNHDDDDHNRPHAKGRDYDYESNHGQDWHAGVDSQRVHSYDGYGYPDEAQPHDSNSLEQGEFKEYDQMEADGDKGQYHYDHPEAHDSLGKERRFGMEYDYQQKDRPIEQDVDQ